MSCVSTSVDEPCAVAASRWVTNLAIFSGLLYRKHPETDVKPVLCWAVRALAEGGEAGMAAGKVKELRSIWHLLSRRCRCQCGVRRCLSLSLVGVPVRHAP